MSRSNLFANLENKFEFADKDTITQIALESTFKLIMALDGMNDKTRFGACIVAAKLGTCGDGVINDDEKGLLEEVFGRLTRNPVSDVIDLITGEIEEQDYQVVQMLTKLGNEVAMPLLDLILSFAYIDDEFEDDVAERLDGIFGMNLMVDFFQGDQESVPAPKVRLKGLEAEIVKWFRDEDRLIAFDEICDHFPDRSRDEVRGALDSLVDRGLMIDGRANMFDLYGLGE